MYDVVIIGGGVAGLAASIYAARFNLKTIIFDSNFGGMIKNTHLVENYPGFISLTGIELAKKIEEHARSYKETEFIKEKIIDLEKKDNLFLIKTEDEEYQSKTIIFAIGTGRKKLNIPGEKEFTTKGVSYCATCDAPLFKNKIVGVVGGSNSAAKEALLIAEHARKVYIIYRKENLRAEPINIKKIEENDKIEVINNTNVTEILGRDFIEKVKLDSNLKELKLDGLFVEIGSVVDTELAEELGVKLNENGEVIVNDMSETNVKGVYAAGDCTNSRFKQAIMGVAQGVNAAYSVYNFLNGEIEIY